MKSSAGWLPGSIWALCATILKAASPPAPGWVCPQAVWLLLLAFTLPANPETWGWRAHNCVGLRAGRWACETHHPRTCDSALCTGGPRGVCKAVWRHLKGVMAGLSLSPCPLLQRSGLVCPGGARLHLDSRVAAVGGCPGAWLLRHPGQDPFLLLPEPRADMPVTAGPPCRPVTEVSSWGAGPSAAPSAEPWGSRPRDHTFRRGNSRCFTPGPCTALAASRGSRGELVSPGNTSGHLPSVPAARGVPQLTVGSRPV